MTAISIKGYRGGVIVTLDDALSWGEAEAMLLEHIQQRHEFFQGSQVALQLGERPLDREDIKKLQNKLAKHDVQLAALLGQSAETIREARRLEIDTELDDGGAERPLEDGSLPPIDNNEYGITGVLVKTTLRSGRIVRHVGHVVVIGDVNPGAQIIAGGDVLVWGRLRGTVHAGANGDEEALVCALDMRPMQLRIANHVAISPEVSGARPHPEIAMVQDGQIVAEEWGS